MIRVFKIQFDEFYFKKLANFFPKNLKKLIEFILGKHVFPKFFGLKK
jgi:hypothetical protein